MGDSTGTCAGVDVSYLHALTFEEVRAVFLEAYKGQRAALELQIEALQRQRRELCKVIAALEGKENGKPISS